MPLAEKNITPIKVALAVAFTCLLLYLPALTCGFIGYDDPEYVLNNRAIQTLSWEFLTTVFTQVQIVWWMPLTWISLAIDYHFWGLNPVGYHLTNIVLHACNAGLIVLIADELLRGVHHCGVTDGADRADGYLYPGALLLAGLLWGIHPLRVESVAWVTERKDVLNGLFSIGSMLLYVKYAARKVRGESAPLEYLASLLLFALSLMSKSVSVVLPLMLLLADWYPFGRLRQGMVRRVVVEKIPFLALSITIACLTLFLTAQSRYLVSYDYFPFWQRLLVAGNAVIAYWRYLLLPIGISPLHLIPETIPAAYAVTTLLAVVVSIGAILLRRQHCLVAVWFCFLLPLLPVLAFFQNGDQSFAARFTYLPSIAPCIAVAGIFMGYGRRLATEVRFRRIVIIVSGVYLIFCGAMTVSLIGVWHDAGTFWTRAIQIEPLAAFYKERGKYYYAQGNYTAAVADYTAAITGATGYLRANIFNLHILRAEVLRAAGRHEAAIADYSAAISLYPQPVYYYYRGLSFKALGRLDEAEADFRQAGDAQGPVGWYEK